MAAFTLQAPARAHQHPSDETAVAEQRELTVTRRLTPSRRRCFYTLTSQEFCDAPQTPQRGVVVLQAEYGQRQAIRG